MLVAMPSADARALVLLLAFVGQAVAQPASVGAVYHIDHFTVEDGLAQNKLVAVAQDRTGFMWVGGYRGLQRYDGYSFVRYASLDSAAPPELAGLIKAIRTDARGDPWVEAVEALFRYDASTRRFKRVVLPVSVLHGAWAPDSSGRVWVGGDGALFAIEHDSLSASGVTVQRVFAAPWIDVAAVATSRTGDVWLRLADSAGRIVRLDPRTGAFATFVTGRTVPVRALAEDADGLLWMAGDDGLTLLDPTTGRSREIPALAGHAVMSLARSGPHGVLALSDAGLSEIGNDGRVTREWNTRSVFGNGYLPDAFAFDRDGGVWLASLTTGLFRLDVRAPAFGVLSSRSFPPVALGNDFVTDAAEGSDGTLWISTLRGGAYQVSASGTVIVSLRHGRDDASALASDEVWGIALDRGGTPWLATRGGLCAWDRTGVHCYGPSSGVFDIARDREGWLWIACSDGARSFNPLTRRFGTYVPTASRTLTVFIDTTANDLWLGGEPLGRAHVANGRLVDSLRLTRSGARPGTGMSYQLHRSASGTLWIASDDGLERWDPPQTSEPTRVDLPALEGATVFSIAEDAAHALWLGTSHGLVHYVPSTGASHRYTRQDGVTSGEFNRHAVLARRDGSLLFGGVDGYIEFRPELVPVRHAQPPVVFTHARKVTDGGIVDASLDRTTLLTLDRHDRAITIEFAALSYGATEARRYRFRLEGSSDAEWIETNDHSVTYTPPPSGAYRLRVQAATGEAAWAEPGATLAIDVVPPFWRGRWFEVLALAAAAGLLFGLHRLSLGRALATERLRLRISRDLHDEIGAGLSSIALLSDTARADPRLTDPARSQLRRIGESARDMVADLRDIIWAIDPGADHVDDVVVRMRDLVPTLLPGMRVVFQVPEDHRLADRITMTARRDLLLVYKEILNNVATHARATEVHIELTIASGEVVLTINDNGVGFSANDVRRGTGLKSMRERAQRLGATLVIESEPGRGTTTRLTVRKTRMRRSRPVPTP